MTGSGNLAVLLFTAAGTHTVFLSRCLTVCRTLSFPVRPCMRMDVLGTGRDKCMLIRLCVGFRGTAFAAGNDDLFRSLDITGAVALFKINAVVADIKCTLADGFDRIRNRDAGKARHRKCACADGCQTVVQRQLLDVVGEKCVLLHRHDIARKRQLRQRKTSRKRVALDGRQRRRQIHRLQTLTTVERLRRNDLDAVRELHGRKRLALIAEKAADRCNSIRHFQRCQRAVAVERTGRQRRNPVFHDSRSDLAFAARPRR